VRVDRPCQHGPNARSGLQVLSDAAVALGRKRTKSAGVSLGETLARIERTLFDIGGAVGQTKQIASLMGNFRFLPNGLNTRKL
jgi:hypothetical protein